LIRLENIWRTYDVGDQELHALAGVTEHIQAGEHVAIMGPSGSGKSTLLNIIGCLDRPTKGSYLFDGREVSGLTEDELSAVRREGVGYVFQSYHLIERLDAAGNVELPMIFAGVERAERNRRVEQALEAVRLSDRAAHRPDQLSGGERQRVAIARAFAAKPDLIVLDEPVSSLDVSIQAGVLNLLMELQRKKKVSFVFISHDLNVVRHISNRIAVMYNGRICEMGTPSELLAPPYHPYTEALLAAMPIVQAGVRQSRFLLAEGRASGVSITTDGPGCPFSGRCPRRLGTICDQSAPPNKFPQSDRRLNCHIPLQELEIMKPVLETLEA